MAGDHKCPVCPATFTRPQHVGRHLRAHTGDRPYECKECPLRFARSDLLSRHVNKSHRLDEYGKPPKPAGKQPRRKSMPASALPRPALTVLQCDSPESVSSSERVRRSSFDPVLISSPIEPAQPSLQAQQMYPHHPLLAGVPQQSNQISSRPLNGMTSQHPQFANPFPNHAAGGVTNPVQSMGFQPPFTAMPIRVTGPEHGAGVPMGREMSGGSIGGVSNMGYEIGYKRKACDQCNHSKVRCNFGDPCQRCFNRNFACSYLKPPTSRSINGGQRSSFPLSASSSSMAALSSGSSPSPLLHLSSPMTRPGPQAATMPVPSMTRATHTEVPDRSQTLPYAPTNDVAWMSGHVPGPPWYAVPNPQPSHDFDPTSQRLSQSPQTRLYSAPQHFTNPIPQQPSTSYSGYQTQHRHSQSSSSASPQQLLAPTPSLTSLSTSPSGSEELAERRTSSTSHGFMAPTWIDPSLKNMDTTPVMQTEGPSAMFNKYSSSPMAVTTSLPHISTFRPDFASSAWPRPAPASATLDPLLQIRNPLQPDDEDSATSMPTSGDDSAVQGSHARRRSSAGEWANAFNQMSLRDGSMPTVPDPYIRSQATFQSHMRRPSILAMPNASLPVGPNPAQTPSLGDVKDLWKLFMSDPSAPPLPYGNDGYEQVAHSQPAQVTTPRPGIGARTLSKSNSMPDLTSPLLGPMFFSNFANGATPGPADLQSSYVPVPYPANPVIPPDGSWNKWKREISQRSGTFEFAPHAGSKLASLSPSTAQHEMPSTTGAPPIHVPQSLPTASSSRPIASVMQHPAALQQTLAPERAPSFGFENIAPTRSTLPFNPSGSSLNPQSVTSRAPWNQSKVTSAMARPGNKRLASQTLVPSENGKKASGSGFYWGTDVADEGLADDEGGSGGLSAYQPNMGYGSVGGGFPHVTPGWIGMGMPGYAPQGAYGGSTAT